MQISHCLCDKALETFKLNDIEKEQGFKATSMETLRGIVQVETGVTFISEIVQPMKKK